MLKSAAEGEVPLWVLLPTLNTLITVSHSWHPASQDSWSEPRFYTPGCYIKNRYNHLTSLSWLFPPYLGKVSVRDAYLGGCSQPHTDSHSCIAWKVKGSFFPVLQWGWSGNKMCVYEGTCTFRHLHKAIVIGWITVLDWGTYPPRPASGAQISCSNLALNSLSQVWGFESPACNVLLSLRWVLLWFKPNLTV